MATPSSASTSRPKFSGMLPSGPPPAPIADTTSPVSPSGRSQCGVHQSPILSGKPSRSSISGHGESATGVAPCWASRLDDVVDRRTARLVGVEADVAKADRRLGRAPRRRRLLGGEREQLDHRLAGVEVGDLEAARVVLQEQLAADVEAQRAAVEVDGGVVVPRRHRHVVERRPLRVSGGRGPLRRCRRSTPCGGRGGPG